MCKNVHLSGSGAGRVELRLYANPSPTGPIQFADRYQRPRAWRTQPRPGTFYPVPEIDSDREKTRCRRLARERNKFE